ncbi:MAG: hypothetical protein ACI4FZ_07295 [Lachnospiraceae bacterium]
MAGKSTNKRSTGTGSKGNSRRTVKNTGKRSGSRKKSSSDDTMKLLLVLVIAGIAIAMLLFRQKSGDNAEQAGGQATPVPTAPATPTETVPGPTKEPETTPTPIPTSAPTVTPEATPKPTETIPTPTPVAISPEDAIASIKQMVDTSVYEIELLNDHLSIEDNEYYQFLITESGRDLEPFLIVDKGTGSIWCYDVSGKVSECRKFPLDDASSTGNTGISSNGTITAEQAYDVLCTYSKEKLGLAKEVTEYTPEYDSTLTLVKGMNCYRINLTEVLNGKVRNRGEFYISIDGKQCFCIDNDLGEFIPIQ